VATAGSFSIESMTLCFAARPGIVTSPDVYYGQGPGYTNRALGIVGSVEMHARQIEKNLAAW
jgi:hypothetical protein